MKNRLIKRAMTLIEIMLVVCLIAVIASVAGFFMFRAIVKERFQADVNRLIDNIYLARELAMQLDMDITLNIRKNSTDKMTYVLSADKPLPAGLALLKSNRFQSPIVSISLNGARLQEIELHISKFGTLTPEGHLVFTHERGEDLAMNLSSFPQIGPRQFFQARPRQVIPYPKEVLN